jgi:hypothetical protein
MVVGVGGALASWCVWEECFNLAIGIWLVIAPFVIGFYHACSSIGEAVHG